MGFAVAEKFWPTIAMASVIRLGLDQKAELVAFTDAVEREAGGEKEIKMALVLSFVGLLNEPNQNPVNFCRWKRASRRGSPG